MKAVKYFPLQVTEKIQETENAVSFCLKPAVASDSARFYYKPAQFLTFKLNIQGADVIRSYSLSSSPLAGEEGMRTTVARVPGGKASNHLTDFVQKGDRILSQPPQGEFFSLPSDLKPRRYMLFAAGIGITPLFSILKTALHAFPDDRVYLLYSSRDRRHIIYRKELEALGRRFPERLQVKHLLSREKAPAEAGGSEGGEKGRGEAGRSYESARLNEAILQRELNGSLWLKEGLFYLCGPKDYMAFVQGFLKSRGVDRACIHTEDFKTAPLLGPKPDENSVVFAAANGAEEAEPEILEAVLDGETVRIPIDRKTSLLEQLLDGGHSPPFSCTSGSCMTCMARLKKGRVFQPEEGVLDEENIKALEVLTCQAYPLSRTVVLDYDDI